MTYLGVRVAVSFNMRIFAIAFTLVMLLCTSAFSDVVYFKDGGEAEGIITEEAEDYIVIDIGFGTMTVRRDEIDSIEKATTERLEELEKEKFVHKIDRGEWAPEGFEEIRVLYRQAKNDKLVLQGARRKSRAARIEISVKEKRVSDLLGMLDKKGRKLKGMDAKKDTKTYNTIVAEMNTINVHLNKENKNITNLYAEEKKLNKELTALATTYRSNFQLFRDTWDNKRSGINKDEAAPDAAYFFEEMDTKMQEMDGDFSRDIARYTPKNGHIIVDTLINDNASAQLIVDTGATIVVISADVASRLGIDPASIATKIDIVMADGSSAASKPVILKSVKVGNAEVKNVQAAILESASVGGADGLLGMSFLSNFVIKVDSASNKLILEKVL